MDTILIRFGEIALKGKNRPFFIRQFERNIVRTLEIDPDRLERRQAQYVIQARPEEISHLLAGLGKVCGVAWFAATRQCALDMEEMSRLAIQAAVELGLGPDCTFRIRAGRSDSSLPFTSVDVEFTAGEAVVAATGAGVDLESPDHIIYISAGWDYAYVYTEKLSGPGGLPVGVSGKVLALLSGGPDSVAAAYQLAKRGAQVDFLHFHTFPRARPALDAKMAALARSLSAYTLSQRLYLSEYTPFQMQVLDLSEREAGYELVLFRRLMVRVAQRLSNQYGYQAIVMGDSLGQVASQTIENLIAVDDSVRMPIFRPLIGMDKMEIIQLVRDLALFDLANEPYKDCCSILAPNPVTKAYLPKVRKLEKERRLAGLAEEMTAAVETWEISPGS